MTIEKTIKSLSDIERQTIRYLSEKKPKTIEEISDESKLHIDSVRRAVNWLTEKKLAKTDTQTQSEWKLTPAGKSSLSNGLPEILFLRAITDLNGKATLEQIYKKSQLNRPELNAAMGLCRKNAWITVSKQENEVVLELTGIESEILERKYRLQETLIQVSKGNQPGKPNPIIEDLRRRGLIEERAEKATLATLTTEGAAALPLLEKNKTRNFDVQGEVPELFFGKKQPYQQFLKLVTRKLNEMGFMEMDSPLVTQEFYNFDVLFQPQNHPARSWTDTYQLKQPKTGKLPPSPVVSAIKAAHENGGKSQSTGWQYDWSEEIARRVMPTAHGTAHSARQLVKGVSIPGKYYTIARCFRPDVVDATHLIKFNQMEGIVIGDDLNFRHLLGLLKQFAVEFAGAEEVKFAPS